MKSQKTKRGDRFPPRTTPFPMCLYPKLILNPKYKPNKKNGGNPPIPTDKRVMAVPIACGVCQECREKISREWKIRLNEELKECNEEIKAWYITLTFSEESLMKLDSITEQESEYKENDIATKATRLFLERWRKKWKKSCKHWFITELGHENTERIHLHGIIFTSTEKIKELEKTWSYGWVDIGTYCNGETIGYITKYITKIDNDHRNFKGKILCSSGIGKIYITDGKTLNRYRGEATKEYYRSKEGYKMNLPIYYRNNFYTEEQREKLWLNKLDKGERYITGTKYEFKTNEDITNYINALKTAQEDNIKNGYQKPDWKVKDYMQSLKMTRNPSDEF